MSSEYHLDLLNERNALAVQVKQLEAEKQQLELDIKSSVNAVTGIMSGIGLMKDGEFTLKLKEDGSLAVSASQMGKLGMTILKTKWSEVLKPIKEILPPLLERYKHMID